MTDLERALRSLAAEVDWPPPPEPILPAGMPRPARSLRRPLVAAAALAIVALAVALSVPGARSAILHLFRIGGATVEHVQTLPRAKEVPLDALLGPTVSRADAERILAARVRLPGDAQHAQLHLEGQVVSAIVRTADGPVLVSQFRSIDAGILVKKIAGPTTRIASVTVAPGTTGFWLTGGRHVVVEPSPARYAGNVLLWDVHDVTYRLEGRRLELPTAVALALSMQP
jgi:hypothetical protein